MLYIIAISLSSFASFFKKLYADFLLVFSILFFFCAYIKKLFTQQLYAPSHFFTSVSALETFLLLSANYFSYYYISFFPIKLFFFNSCPFFRLLFFDPKRPLFLELNLSIQSWDYTTVYFLAGIYLSFGFFSYHAPTICSAYTESYHLFQFFCTIYCCVYP